MPSTTPSVWLDAEGSQSRAYLGRGISRYIADQASAIWENAPEAVHTIALSPDLPRPGALDALLDSGALSWKQLELPSPLPNVFHVMSPIEQEGPPYVGMSDLERIWPRWARANGIRTVVSLYDLIPLVFREVYLDHNPSYAASYLARLQLVRSAHQVLTISENTAADAIEHLGVDESRVTVAGVGVSTRIASLVSSPESGRQIVRMSVPQIRPGFLLYVGGDEFRKNLDGMLRSYALLPGQVRAEHQLVIVCQLSEGRKAELRARARRLGIEGDQLQLTGYVDDRMLAALYRSCALFVFPSLYEGAGLPVLEAMSCGAPVAASESSSIPEVLGDSRATFDPASPEDTAACLERVVDDEAELAALRERSIERAALFSWERVAERTLGGYERALSLPGPRTPRRAPRRLAVFTPWHPDPSGVANHSRLLLEELSSYADIDVVVAGGAGADGYDRSLEPRVSIQRATEFDLLREIRDYDRVLYVIGNSRFHVHALEALIARPGVVLAHDVRLTGLYEAAGPPGPEWMVEKLRQMYGDRVPEDELPRLPDLVTEDKYGIFMTQEIQAHAERLLVHSRHAVELLRLECPPGTRRAPAEVVSLGIHDPVLRGGGDRASGPLVVSYGFVGLIKGLDTMVHAFARLASERPGARMLLVGEVVDFDREYLNGLAAELGITDSLEVRGRVDEGEYWRILGAADVALQLRLWSNGEASAAVTDCIAARVPTIASDIGWFRELPDGVVLRVPRHCSPEQLAARMDEAIDDRALRAEIRAAQEDYVAAHSYAKVARHYAELLEL